MGVSGAASVSNKWVVVQFSIIEVRFNGNIRPMKSTTSVYIAIIGLEYLIIACYVCIITYKGL